MAILHGSWLLQPQSDSSARPIAPSASTLWGNRFFLWGEVWRRVEPLEAQSSLQSHPYSMTGAELGEWLRSLYHSKLLNDSIAPLLPTASEPAGQRKRKRTATAEPEMRSERLTSVAIAIPTYQFTHPETGLAAVIPQHSASGMDAIDGAETAPSVLQPWQIEGVWLTPLEVMQFLNSLPLGAVNVDDSWMGRDLRYWSHAARWGLDLLARSKFLPSFKPDQEQGFAFWQVLLDSSTDQERLLQFTRQMPVSCQVYHPIEGISAAPMTPLASELQTSFPSARSLLLSFLNSTTDAQVRSILATQPLPAVKFPKDVPIREWLQALGTDAVITTDADKLESLAHTLESWTAPIQQQLSQQVASFRTCFYLYPPTSGQDWTLEYFLQASDDPDFLVSARTIWSNPVDRLTYLGRAIDQPQETLLAGLGLASRLYPLIEPSLQVSQPQSCKLNPLQVYEFIKSVTWRLQDSGFGVILPPGLSNQQGWASRLGLSIRAETPSGQKQRLGLQSLLNFRWELTIGGQRLSKAEFDRLVALNTPLVEINGEWVELRPSDIRAAEAFFTSRKDQMALSLEDALRISTGDTQIIEKLPVVNFEASGALQELINTLTSGNQNIEAIDVPQTLRAELRPYQLRGVSWLVFMERWGLGACLADDMGLGKTIQFITLLLHLQEKEVLEKPTLLVCPTSVLGNWEREVKRFAPTLKVLVHHGDKRSQGKAFAKAVKEKHLVVTSYALVYRDAKDLQSVSWQGVVLDEAQNVKNSESKQSQAVRQLEANFRIALTGTPVENRLAELWSIMDFLNPGYLGAKNFFQRRFAIPIERYGDTASLQTLRSLVQPFLLRRLKTDRTIIQDLPDKQEMTVFCGLAAEQAALYQRLVDESLVQIESAEGIQRRGMILALLTKLKQVCNHPLLLKNADVEPAPPSVSFANLAAFDAHSGKLKRLSEMLEEILAEGDEQGSSKAQRTLIFTQFAEWGKLMQTYLEKQFNREILFLYGSTSKKNREEMIDRFQNDPQGPRIFILSLKAGGVGLNLTRANHVFHFDRWWNPAVENQATDRVFRIGQTRNVQVHKFVCTGTLEERIHELIESKKALSEQVVGAGENWLTDFDTDQLRNLLLLDRSAVIDDSE